MINSVQDIESHLSQGADASRAAQPSGIEGMMAESQDEGRHPFTAQFGEMAANSPFSQAAAGMSDAFANTASAGYINPQSGSGAAYNMGNIAGNILPYMGGEGLVAKGIGKIAPKVSPLLRRMLASGVASGGQAALQTPGNRTEAGAAGAGAGFGITALTSLLPSWTRLPVRSALGASLGYQLGGVHGAEVGAGLSAASPFLVPSISEKLGEQAALQGVDFNAAQPRMEAARRLGLSHLTPAEATGSPFVAANQGMVGRTGESSQFMYEKGQQRLASERKSITGLMDEVYNEKRDSPEVKKLYEKAYQAYMPADLLENAKQSSSIINDAFERVKKDPEYQDKLKGVPENNFAYLDQVKRALDDRRQSFLNSGEKDKARLVREQVDAMKGLMDHINPDYKAARELSERGIARSSMERKMNDNEITGTNFYNKFLRNDNQFDKLRFSLRNVPNAQQKLDDMRTVFRDLINPRTVKTAFGQTEHGMKQSRNFLDAAKDFLHSLNGRRYDRAFIELISNPRWDTEFASVMQEKEKGQKMRMLSNLLSKASAYGISQALSSQKEGT